MTVSRIKRWVHLRTASEPGMFRVFGYPGYGTLLELSWSRWLWLTRGYRPPYGTWTLRTFPVSLKLINWGDHDDWSFNVSAVFFTLYVKIPFLPKRKPVDISDDWGFSLYSSDLHLGWGSRFAVIRMPWAWEHEHTEWLISLKDEVDHYGPYRAKLKLKEEWMEEPKRWDDAMDFRKNAPLWSFHHLYCWYSKREDKCKHTIATVYVKRVTMVMRGFHFVRKFKKYLDVHFHDPVGDSKGGCTSCCFEMRENETPYMAIFRMENLRSFND